LITQQSILQNFTNSYPPKLKKLQLNLTFIKWFNWILEWYNWNPKKNRKTLCKLSTEVNKI